MLDKSIPYFDICMCLPKESPRPALPPLPIGYSFKPYAPEDAPAWCEIETSVGEFLRVEDAKEYFGREYAPHPKALATGMALVVNALGVPVANASAWWKEDETRGRVRLLHWVAVRPEEQGKGLGRAVSVKALSLFENPQEDIWLHTQTWSHVAVDLYLSLGFRAHKTAVIARHKNGFDSAVRVLESVMRPKSFAKFMYTAM